MCLNHFRKPVLTILLALSCISITLPFFTTPAKADTFISAECAVLYQPDRDEFIYEKSSKLRRPMASTTKIMTALVAIESCQLSDTVAVDAAAVGIEGSSVALRPGEQLTIEDLLYLMLLDSANDAAAAIAIHAGGSIDGFARMMNKKAEEMGLQNTHFTNPHGLSEDDHYTTAADLARIASTALENETFSKIVSTKNYSLKLHNGETSYTASNHNKLLRMYDGACGVKTGFTKKSGRCLVGAAERNGVKLISVTLNAPDDWRDHMQLFDLGFESFESVELAHPGEFSFSLPIIAGEKDTIKVTNRDPLSVVLPRGSHDISHSIEINRSLIAPVERGDEIGCIVFKDSENVVGRLVLVAAEDAFGVK